MSRERHPYSLVGIDGNAFSIIAYTINAMRQCGYSKDSIETYKSKALASDSYDDLLSLSVMMVDNCNKLSGYPDQFQQLMKGHDDLEYVDYPHTGIQNSHEQLINEDFQNFNFEEVEDDQTDERYQSDDYMRLYSSISSVLKSVLNNMIAYGNKFSKSELRVVLNQIIKDENFWDELEYDIPNHHINEGIDSFSILRATIQDHLVHALYMLLDDDVKFTKYDVYHVFMQILNSPTFFGSLYKYVPDGD